MGKLRIIEYMLKKKKRNTNVINNFNGKIKINLGIKK